MGDGRVGIRGLYVAPPVEAEHSPALEYAMPPLLLVEERIVRVWMKKTETAHYWSVQVRIFLMCSYVLLLKGTK
jgi:hypothetical protein